MSNDKGSTFYDSLSNLLDAHNLLNKQAKVCDETDLHWLQT
jgi:hypothetical protein